MMDLTDIADIPTTCVFSSRFPFGPQDVSTLGLAFCPPSVLLANVPVGADGVVRLAPEQLAAAVAAAVGPAGVPMSSSDPWVAAGHRVVRLIAYTAPAGACGS